MPCSHHRQQHEEEGHASTNRYFFKEKERKKERKREREKRKENRDLFARRAKSQHSHPKSTT